MRFPIQLTLSLTAYLLKNAIAGRTRFPIVLMLEPLHLCNLACDGCGRIREYEDTIRDQMSLDECLTAVDSCGAPIVSICGGEPTLYPHIVELVEGILRRKKHLYLCTNGIRLVEFLPRFTPSPYFTINVSMDGSEEYHDRFRGRKGLYKIDIHAIKKAKEMGFRVITNTTIYNDTDMKGIEALFEELTALKVDGMLVTPGYAYEAIEEKEIFLTRQGISEKFQYLLSLSHKFRFYNTPLYLKFLAGERHLDCTPWGNVTVNPQGWKGPCYLITDAHYKTFHELMDQTDWEKYEKRNDPRCTNCMVHSGCEATAIREVGKSFRDVIDMIRWNLG